MRTGVGHTYMSLYPTVDVQHGVCRVCSCLLVEQTTREKPEELFETVLHHISGTV